MVVTDHLEDFWSDRARTASLRKCDFEVSTEMGAGFLPSISRWTLQKEHSRQEALQMGGQAARTRVTGPAYMREGGWTPAQAPPLLF